MGNETMINRDVNASATQINNAAVNSSSSSNTIVNSALYSLSQIPVGTVLCDKYKVISELNIMSGEASLFICECNGEKYVAKLYRRDVAIKDDVTNALKNISSPHVAKLFDTGVYNGLPFEIIPFYAQGSLQGRTFSFDELKQRIIPSLNEGLHVLHENGIIHKDLKPSNIMLCDNEEDVVIIDFGISSVKGGSNTVIVTKTGMTPEYSASETFRNLFLEESDYYRCHLIAYELCGVNDDTRNLITGTRHLNLDGMLNIEDQVCWYVRNSGNHVKYRVTPWYEGNNLVATGVQIEACSVEDDGAGICLNVFCFNVQPGVVIDYSTGESYAETVSDDQPSAEITRNVIEPEPDTFTPNDGVTYVLNTNTYRFHLPDCQSVQDMKEKNRQKRYVREGFDSDEELTMFDLLVKDSLTKEEIKQVKKLAQTMLAKIKARIHELDHWRDKEETQSIISVMIRDLLWAELPESYDDVAIADYRQQIYEYVYNAYPAA